MDARTQDAIERLGRDTNFELFMRHIRDRREVYLDALITTPAGEPSLVAKAQGNIQAIDEILRIPTEVQDLKSKRTNND